MGTTIHSIKKTAGVAGQFQLTAAVQYEGEEVENVSFVGSAYGGPVVMVSPTGAQVFVTAPERFGPALCESWVRNFFADDQGEA